jgi:hypothetical protein
LLALSLFIPVKTGLSFSLNRPPFCPNWAKGCGSNCEGFSAAVFGSLQHLAELLCFLWAYSETLSPAFCGETPRKEKR